MTIFAVIALDQTADNGLAGAVQSKFPGKVFQVAKGHFLINSIGTTQEISQQLGIHTGALGQTIVYSITGYFGYAQNTTWEWLRENMSTGAAGATGASGI